MFQQQNAPIISDTFGNTIGELESGRLAREKEQKRKNFQDRVAKLIQKTAEMHKDRGPEDNITVLLTSFLDVAIEMETLMDTMASINLAMECMNDAIGFLDAAIDFDNALMDQSLEHSYSFWQRMKMRSKMRKTIKNNCGRMLAIAKGLEMKYTMAQDMLKALSGVGDKLKKTMTKKQKNAKAGVNSGPTAAQKAISAYLGSNGSYVTSSTQTSSTTSTTTKGSDDGNIDDIA